MSNRQIAEMYIRGALRDGPVERASHGGDVHLIHKGIYLRCHSTAPPPAAYDAWWQANAAARGRSRIGCGRACMDGNKLRRAVALVRNGHSVSSAAKAIRHSPESLKKWLAKLPPDLAA